MYEPNWLDDYKSMLIDEQAIYYNLGRYYQENIPFLSADGDVDEVSNQNPALGFDEFLEYSMNQLNEVFDSKFKKNQLFHQMLMEICKAEAKLRLMR